MQIAFYAIGALLLAIYFVGVCLIFRKAGIHPLKALIPVYGQYLLYKLADCADLFVLQIALGITSGLLGIIVSITGNATFGYVIYAIGAFTILMSTVLLCMGLADVFGKGKPFTVGLFFLQPIFLCILGFGKAEYHKSTGTVNTAKWICSNCGEENPVFKVLCKCGTEKAKTA